MSGASAIAAAIAAKKKRERQQKEEEIMTKYSAEDLDGWKFTLAGRCSDSVKIQS